VQSAKSFEQGRRLWGCRLGLALWVLIVAPSWAWSQSSAIHSVPTAPLSSGAQELIRGAFVGLEGPIVDEHVHIVGLGKGGTGCEVNPHMLSRRHPFKRILANLYLSASGAKDFEHFDQEYVERLVGLARGFGHPVRLHILALDHAYHPDGSLDAEHTEFYVPNDYVVRLAEQYPDIFVPVISVHPARADALAELEKWAAKGVRYLKWLPNAQGIDAADPRWDPFYRRMRELGIVLITHTGEEKAVAVRGGQVLGNPLRFRRALDAGVTVIMAHCASLGRNEDLDHPGRSASNFSLFQRLMSEERYRGRLFGDISAMTQFNRLSVLRQVAASPELQARLVNGSDYPLPAMDCVIWTAQLVRMGRITSAERRSLNEIFRRNPLLFDFVLKRILRDPKTGQRLSDHVFSVVPTGEQR